MKKKIIATWSVAILVPNIIAHLLPCIHCLRKKIIKSIS
jgi:hypothetical protein